MNGLAARVLIALFDMDSPSLGEIAALAEVVLRVIAELAEVVLG